MPSILQKRVDKQFKAIALVASGMDDKEVAKNVKVRITTLKSWLSQFKDFSNAYKSAKAKAKRIQDQKKKLISFQNPKDEESLKKELFLESLYNNNGIVSIATRETQIERDLHYRWMVEDNDYLIKATSCQFSTRDIAQHVILQAMTATSPYLLNPDGTLKIDELTKAPMENPNYVDMPIRSKIAIDYIKLAKNDENELLARIEKINQLLGKGQKSAVLDFMNRPKPEGHTSETYNEAIVEAELIEEEKDEKKVIKVS